MAYIRPAGNVRISDTWQGHKNRPTPSSEPGVDYAVGVGTRVVAPEDGVVIGIKDSASGASGRAMMIRTGNDWHRALHLSKIVVRSGTFNKGQIIAKSGASAGGSESGVGAHLHWSYWHNRTTAPTPGITATQDFEAAMASAAVFGLIGPIVDKEDEMFTDADRVLLRAIKTQLGNVHAGIWRGGQVQIGPAMQKFNFGALPIAAQNQELLAKQAGDIEALKAIVEQLTTKQNVAIDAAPVEAARDRGVREANAGFLNAPTRMVVPTPDVLVGAPVEGAEDDVVIDPVKLDPSLINPPDQGEVDPVRVRPIVVNPGL